MATISSSLFKKIRRIQLQSTRLANDVLAGAYRSSFKGKGMEFEEVREYSPGDEVRTIDWHVSARMNRLYVKSYREEREMTVTLLIDISSSTQFGSGQQTKKDLITELAAVIAFSAIKNNDKISLILFSSKIEKYLPARKGTRHALRILRELLVARPNYPGTDIGTALSFLNKTQTHQGICFLISDFIAPDYSHEAAITTRKHDLVSIGFVDPYESHFPPMDLTTLSDLETGEIRLIDTSSSATQHALEQSCQERLATQKHLMQKLGTDFLTIYTDKPFWPQLKRFLLLRKKRGK